jgi:predicted nucleic acid-binding protein
MLVVDASVALQWFLAEPGSAAAEAVGSRRDLLAPDLILAEVTNGLWRAVRQGRLSVADGGAAARRLTVAFARLVAGGALLERALDVACTLDHPAYDCFYLVLAEREGAPLVTADGRLLTRVSGTVWERAVHPLASFA